jgi:hypothetical protein
MDEEVKGLWVCGKFDDLYATRWSERASRVKGRARRTGAGGMRSDERLGLVLKFDFA